VLLDESLDLLRVKDYKKTAASLSRIPKSQAEIEDVFIYQSHVVDQWQRMNHKINWLLLNGYKILSMAY